MDWFMRVAEVEAVFGIHKHLGACHLRPASWRRCTLRGAPPREPTGLTWSVLISCSRHMRANARWWRGKRSCLWDLYEALPVYVAAFTSYGAPASQLFPQIFVARQLTSHQTATFTRQWCLTHCSHAVSGAFLSSPLWSQLIASLFAFILWACTQIPAAYLQQTLLPWYSYTPLFFSCQLDQQAFPQTETGWTELAL